MLSRSDRQRFPGKDCQHVSPVRSNGLIPELDFGVGIFPDPAADVKGRMVTQNDGRREAVRVIVFGG
jgi:hypothetical protein